MGRGWIGLITPADRRSQGISPLPVFQLQNHLPNFCRTRGPWYRCPCLPYIYAHPEANRPPDPLRNCWKNSNCIHKSRATHRPRLLELYGRTRNSNSPSEGKNLPFSAIFGHRKKIRNLCHSRTMSTRTAAHIDRIA